MVLPQKSASKPAAGLSRTMVSLPPYRGTSAVVVWVVAVDVVVGLVTGVDVVEVGAIVVVCVVVVFVVVVVVGVDVAQDASSIAATIKKLRLNQITLFLNSYLQLD